MKSTIATQAECVVFLPGRTSGCVIVTMAFAQATVLLPNASESTSFAAFVYWVNNPVNAGITANRFVVGINQDDLVVFVYTILIYPVRVEDS